MPAAERCLWCGGPLLNGCTISEMMFADDSLCGVCRSQLTPVSHQVKLGGLTVRGLVVYDEAFMKMLVQYKECMDEALQDVFLQPWCAALRRRYRHFTLVPMPSSRAKREKRGFDTIPQLFSGLGLPIVELLEDGGLRAARQRLPAAAGCFPYSLDPRCPNPGWEAVVDRRRAHHRQYAQRRPCIASCRRPSAGAGCQPTLPAAFFRSVP